MPGRVLIVDPDRGTRDLLSTSLVHDGFEVSVASDPGMALALAGTHDVIVADLAAGLVAPIKGAWPHVEVVVLAAAAAIDDAVAAIAGGAFDFVLRPFFVDDISLSVACAAARSSRRLEMPLAFTLRNHELLRRF